MLQGNETTRERRLFERLLLHCPVRFKAEQENALAEGSAKDISDAGLGLFTHTKINPNTRLEMWINLSPVIKPLRIQGEVVWARQGCPDLWRAGIRFNQQAFPKLVKLLMENN